MALSCRALLARARPWQGTPGLCRGIVQSNTDNFGRKRIVGSPTTNNRLPQVSGQPSLGLGPNAAAGPAGPVLPSAPHHRALQRLAEMVPLEVGGTLDGFRNRRMKVRENTERMQQEDVFMASYNFLMAPERWTYGNMSGYARKMLDLMGAYGWTRRLSGDDPSIKHLEKEVKVLEAMTPVELQSNHYSVFTEQAKRLIAEKSGTSKDFVENVILSHDVLRADRRWYMILKQFNRPLPKTFEDRQWMAEMDRPYSQMENEKMQEMIEERNQHMKKKPPGRFKHIWYRHPTCGGNQWSARPPRWYPTQWKMRPERSARLAGVGVPGGGGDRGRPWGRLATLRRTA